MSTDKDLLEKIIAEEEQKDLPKPWERQEYENDRMYGAFRYYANLPAVERTLGAAYRAYLKDTGKPQPKRVIIPAAWKAFFRAEDSKGQPLPGAAPWVLRARAEDDYKQEIIQRVQLERQAQLRTREWEMSEKLFERAKQMLTFPLARTETIKDPKGNPIQVIIEPVGWKEEDVARTLATASKIARMSTDMPTTQIKVDWRKEIARKGVDPEELLNNVVGEIEKQLELADATSD